MTVFGTFRCGTFLIRALCRLSVKPRYAGAARAKESTNWLAVFLLSLTLLSAAARGDSLVYVINAGITGNGQFGTINLSTGAYQQMGPAEPDGYDGLTSGPNGSFLSLTYAGNLDSINPATGVPTKIGAVGLAPCVVASPACGTTYPFTLGGANGQIYATNFNNDLFSINPLTAASTKLPATGLPAAPFMLGTQNPDGTLNLGDEAIWGSGGKLYVTFDAFVFDPNLGDIVSIAVAPKLYQVDPLTGATKVIGSTDLGIGGATDVNGTTYVLDDLTFQMSTLDLSTGKTSFVGYFDPSAGIINGAAPTPEPASVALVLLGMTAILWRKRLRLPSGGL